MINYACIYQYLLLHFTAPVDIGTTPQSLLWSLPLIATISIVYKAIKLQEISFASFVKEVFLLFCSIILFMLITAIVLFAIIKAVIG